MRIRSIAPRLGLAALAAAALAVPALAADYPVLRGSQIEDAPPAPSSFSWDGFYVGGGAGVSETKFKPGSGLQELARFAFRNTLLGSEVDMGNLLSSLPDKRDSGATFFGLAGYNWSFGDVVLGFEADYTQSSHRYLLTDYIARRAITSNGTVNDFSLTTSQGAKLHDYATARLRMGWAYGNLMPFATIGGAVGRFNTLSTITATNYLTQINPVTGLPEQGQANGYPLTVGAAKKNVYSFGMAVGAGVDWALADNIFLRGEYQHIRFADVEGTTTTVNTGRAALGVKF
ncbi:outer membrane beta-barrel protein [Bosea sp. (in: a-proteobacteria)]|uniref:outer membrane protein n=1 Tax=Bosea sp. (in: a-proteobacteria) TaxID=1871050 RepID=UPI00261CB96E|nr:outer membrane beta-barrel protein [Bosea sp. (in: a-proteobacteria)]MCO5092626.1 outer membrane beta-barrel protein [Bosea sp. (in: a-proteobacteria)]